jgi:hypothetical protein
MHIVNVTLIVQEQLFSLFLLLSIELIIIIIIIMYLFIQLWVLWSYVVQLIAA